MDCSLRSYMEDIKCYHVTDLEIFLPFIIRAGNIFPYDHSRVVLTDGDSDYINANYMSGYSREKEYIASQGPLPNTQSDFWRMVWEQKAILVVMVTNEEEKGKVRFLLLLPHEEILLWRLTRQKAHIGGVPIETAEADQSTLVDVPLLDTE